MGSLFLSWALAGLLATTSAWAAMCTPDLEAGERCRIRIRDLRPTQSVVGMVDVRAKRRELSQGSEEAKDLLKTDRAQVVIGPGGKYHLIDRHHLTYAAYQEGWRHTYAEVVENLSHLSEEDFWNTMRANGWVHLKDPKGGAIEPRQLPRYIQELKNDPYRSLAWLVRKSEAYRKTEIPFAEFAWADYFRDRIPIGPGQAGWDKAVKEAIAMATTMATKSLPGHEPVAPSQRARLRERCWENFEALKAELR